MPKIYQKGKYKYVLTLDEYVWPRHLADELSQLPSFKHFISITDLQNNTHAYGDTYIIPHEKQK